jgi:hypothetical protein
LHILFLIYIFCIYVIYIVIFVIFVFDIAISTEFVIFCILFVI